MLQFNQMITDQPGLFVLAITGLLVIMFIAILVQGSRLCSMRKRYEAMMSGSGIEGLEDLLIDLKNQSERLEEVQEKHEAAIQAIGSRISGLKANVAMKRYNAFGERGNDLSFSLAILDDNRNGVVLTGLHNRDNSYIYSKPVQAGESQYALSPEEKEVVTLALQRA